MRRIRLTLLALLVLTAGTLARPREALAPGQPKNLKATADGPYAVNLDWRRVGDAEFYRVYRDGNRVAESTASEYRDEGLEPETTYEYRVSAVDDGGDEGKLSDPAEVTTEPLPGPPPPQDLTAVAAGPTQIDLTWTPPPVSALPVQGYSVYRDGELVGFVTSTAFADTGLSPETTYLYSVSSVDDRGVEGERSEEAPGTTDAATDVIPPAPPTGLRVIGG